MQNRKQIITSKIYDKKNKKKKKKGSKFSLTNYIKNIFSSLCRLQVKFKTKIPKIKLNS